MWAPLRRVVGRVCSKRIPSRRRVFTGYRFSSFQQRFYTTDKPESVALPPAAIKFFENEENSLDDALLAEEEQDDSDTTMSAPPDGGSGVDATKRKKKKIPYALVEQIVRKRAFGPEVVPPSRMKPSIFSVRPYKPYYSDTAMLPKAACPYPDDPPAGREFRETTYHSSTWLSPRQNDGHGSVTYQLLNFHWRIHNTFDLEACNDFKIMLKKLDGGDYPAAIIIKATSVDPRCTSLSPGGDMRSVFNRDMKYSRAFFKAVYEVCYMLATMRKPTFPCIQGETMGVGAGFCLHSLYRIASEDSVWGFPNTLYGSFPDCGATWYLPRLKGEMGMYLALTGRRVVGHDIARVGIATHYLPSDHMEMFERHSAMYKGLDPQAEILEAFLDYPTSPMTVSALFKVEKDIEACFGKETLEEVFKTLTELNTPWAQRTLSRLNRCSPLMLHVTFRLQRIGRYIHLLDEALHLEYRVALHMLECEDLYEGIKARIIDPPVEREPKWLHKDIYSVPNGDIAQFFVKHPREDDLVLEPCHPGTSAPIDPLRIYNTETSMRLKDPFHLFNRQINSFLPEEQQTSPNMVELFKTFMRGTSLPEEAGEYYYKEKILDKHEAVEFLMDRDIDGKTRRLHWMERMKRLSEKLEEDDGIEDYDMPKSLGAEGYKIK